jgi:hypothetical protein
MITYNHTTNCCNSVDKFDGNNSGIHVLAIVKISNAFISWNGCLLFAISTYKKKFDKIN